MFEYVDRAGANTPPLVKLDRASRRIQPIYGQNAEIFDARIHEADHSNSREGTYARFLPDERITYRQANSASAPTYNAGAKQNPQPEKNAAPPRAGLQSQSAGSARDAGSSRTAYRLPPVQRFGKNGELFFMPPKLTKQDTAQMKALGLYIKHHSLNPFHSMNPVVTEATYLVNKAHRLIHIVDDSGSMAADERDGKRDTRWEDAHHFVGVQTGITTHAGGEVVMAFLNDHTTYTFNEQGVTSRDRYKRESTFDLPRSSWYDVSNQQQRLYHRIHKGVEQVFQVHSPSGGTPLLGSIERVLRKISLENGSKPYLGEDNQYHRNPYLVIISTDGHPTDTKNIVNWYDSSEKQSQFQRRQVDELAAVLHRAISGEFTQGVPVRFSFRLCTDETDVVYIYRSLLQNHPEIGPFVDVTAHLRDEQQAYRNKHPNGSFMDMPHRRDLKVQSMIGPTTNLSRIKNKNLPVFYTEERAVRNPGKDVDTSPAASWAESPNADTVLGIPVAMPTPGNMGN